MYSNLSIKNTVYWQPLGCNNPISFNILFYSLWREENTFNNNYISQWRHGWDKSSWPKLFKRIKIVFMLIDLSLILKLPSSRFGILAWSQINSCAEFCLIFIEDEMGRFYPSTKPCWVQTVMSNGVTVLIREQFIWPRCHSVQVLF